MFISPQNIILLFLFSTVILDKRSCSWSKNVFTLPFGDLYIQIMQYMELSSVMFVTKQLASVNITSLYENEQSFLIKFITTSLFLVLLAVWINW